MYIVVLMTLTNISTVIYVDTEWVQCRLGIMFIKGGVTQSLGNAETNHIIFQCPKYAYFLSS